MKSADLLSQRVNVAWPADRLRQLGPSQKHRLGAWLAVDREKNGDDGLTVPALEGMLEKPCVGPMRSLCSCLNGPQSFTMTAFYRKKGTPA